MSRLEKFVESRIFRNVVFAVVLLNAVLLGVQCCSKWSENVETRLSLGLDFCLVFFVAETILKLVALRSGYFGNRWNCLDFAIVLISVIAEYSGILSIRMLRLVRSVFTLKIFSGSGNIQRDILAILESALRIFWTMALLLVFFYIFSIAGVSFFGEAFPEKFGNLGKSMLSLFQVTILDSWQDINLPVIKRYPCAIFYFIPFILISSFILLNIIVGIIVDATSSVARFRSKDDWFRKNYCGRKSELKEHIAKFQHYLNGFYEECAQSLIKISKDSLTDCLKEFGVVQKAIVVKNKLVQKKFRNDKWRYIYFALPGCDEKDFMIHLEWPFSIEDLALKKSCSRTFILKGKGRSILKGKIILCSKKLSATMKWNASTRKIGFLIV